MYSKRYLRNFDFIMVLLIILIVCFGLIGIGIATRSPVDELGEGLMDTVSSFNFHYVRLQILWFVTGLVMMAIVISIDYRIIGNLSPYIYWTVIALLVMVQIFGSTGGGAQRWLELGPFRLQPSEFAKLSVIIALARTLSKKKKDEEEEDEREGIYHIKQLIPVTFILIIPFALVFKQPDLGTSLVLIAIMFGMLFVAGLSYKLLAAGIGLGLVSIPLAWLFLLEDFQKDRIMIFLNPGLDPTGAGMQVLHSMMTIGSGQMTGQITGEGIFQGNTLSQLNYLPASETDFIFSVTAEALGFVGGISIIGLFLLLLIRTIWIAVKAKDKLGSLLVIGVASMTLFHVFQNIGMTMGLMPITGLPLPFVSYGGSSMWTNMVAFGLVINVGMRRHKIKF